MAWARVMLLISTGFNSDNRLQNSVKCSSASIVSVFIIQLILMIGFLHFTKYEDPIINIGCAQAIPCTGQTRPSYFPASESSEPDSVSLVLRPPVTTTKSVSGSGISFSSVKPLSAPAPYIPCVERDDLFSLNTGDRWRWSILLPC